MLKIYFAIISTMIQQTNSQPSFPLEKFLNISYLFETSRYFENKTFFDADEYIQQRDLLNDWREKILCGRKGYAIPNSCDCTKKCMRFKTCCADAFWNYKNDFTSIKNYTKKFLSDALQRKNYYCSEAFPFIRDSNYTSGWYYMISTCPEENGRSIENKLCTSVTTTLGPSTIPVFGRDKYLYKNLYCAKCHNVDEFEIASIILSCKKNKSSCKLKIKHDDDVKACHPKCHDKGRCEPGNKYYERCYSHSGNYKGYDNIFCYRCAKGDLFELSKPLTVVPRYCINDARETPDPYSWFSLLTLTDSGDNEDISRGCSHKEVFSMLTEGCLKLSCPEGFQAINSKCIKILSKNVKMNQVTILSENFKNSFMTNCLIKKQMRLYIMGISNFNAFINTISFSNFFQNSNIFRVHENDESNQHKIFIEMNNITNRLKTFLLSNTGLVNSEFLVENVSVLISSQLAPFQYPHKFHFSNIFMNNDICEKPHLLDKNEIVFSKNCHASYRGETIKNRNLSIWIDVRKGELRKLIYTCKTNLLKVCPYILKKSNLTADKDKELNFSQISVVNVTLKRDERCTFSVQQTEWYLTVEKISGYVSFIGSILSMFSYIFLIVTLCLVTEIRNHYGYCVLSMSINLFLADILYVVGIVLHLNEFGGSLKACLPIGFLMHLFLLSAQFWSLILAVDVAFNVFLAKLVTTTEATKKKFISYCLITYFLAITLATVGVLCNRFDLLDVAYNRSNICALSGFYARMILFFIPLVISTVIGILVLCVSICISSKKNKENLKALGDNASVKKINFTKIALKIVIICGLSEGIGFIQVNKAGTLTDTEHTINSVFRFLYSVMKGFRGVMLCIVYLYNERVKKFYQNILSRHTQSESDNEMTDTS